METKTRWKVRTWTLLLAAAMATAGYAQDQSSGKDQRQEPSAAPETSKPPATQPVKIPEGVFPARLISQPQPVYPREARRKRIEGDVVLHAIIDTMGNIAKLSVISGDPLLVDAAEDAVSKWKYAPTLVNGVPREVETTITVKFELGEKPKGQKPN